MYRTYSLDAAFTERQASAIKGAMAAWGRATAMQACMSADPGGSVGVVRVHTKEQVERFDARTKLSKETPAWGYWDGTLWIVTSRATTDKDVFNIAAHELGHSVGVNHYEGGHPSFMHGSGPFPKENEVTEHDAAEFCRIHKCPRPLP